MRFRLFMLWYRALGLLCLVRPHVWSGFGDEDADGWFWDIGGGANCLTRSCQRCGLVESRDQSEVDASEWAAAVQRSRDYARGRAEVRF
jgi:hypothetical protein